MDRYTLKSSTRTNQTKQRSEVDIRVHQEIKNHNDRVEQMNQSIQSLKQGQIGLSLLYEKSMAKSGSDLNNLLIGFENLKFGVENTLHNMNQRLGEMETRVSGLLDGFLKIKKEIQTTCVDKDDLDNHLECHRDQIDCLQQDLSTHKDGFNSAIVALNHKLRDEFERLKKELTPLPPKVDPVQEKMNSLLEIWKVDCDGLVKEIALLKRSSAYAEKKFENIYTLIERLKSAGGGLFHKQV